MKDFFDRKLSRKSTIVAIVLISAFVFCGMIGAIVGHTYYLNKQEARIVNYSVRENAPLYLRRDGTLVYRYDDGTSSVNALDIIALSDGATAQILRVVTAENVELSHSPDIDLMKNPHVYLFLRVTSNGDKNQTDYILEIVSRSSYKEEQSLPSVIIDNGPILQ